jgi:ubiquinone/menaquinone biosynthesis C-methylase UbiE
LTKAKEVAPKADFKLMDFMHLDFSDNLFDGIWFNAGLLVIEKKYAPQLLLNIFRILKANGILFVSVKEGKGEGLAVDKRYNLEKFYAYYSKSELKETLEKSGFIVLKIDMPNLNSSYHAHKWIIYLCKKPI